MGDVKIEHLRVGDRVIGYDVRQGRKVMQVVEHTLSQSDQPLVSLNLSDGRSVRATKEHPFFVPSLGEYIPIGELAPHTMLLALENDAAPLTQLTALGLASTLPETVYNLTVSGTRNYFAEGILVHNKSPNECPYNASLCPEDPVFLPAEPWCIPTVAASPNEESSWVTCGVSEQAAGGLVLRLDPENASSSTSQSWGGQGGAESVLAPTVVAQAGTRLCQTPQTSDFVSVTLHALQSSVAGQLSVTTGLDVCGVTQEGASAQVIELEAGESRNVCFAVPYQGDHLRLQFETSVEAVTELFISSVVQGLCQ
jgi:hypothetical protein